MPLEEAIPHARRTAAQAGALSEEGARAPPERREAGVADGNAVEVWWSAGPWMLGHIPREDAEHLAPLMDVGMAPRCWACGGKRNGRALWWRERRLIDLPAGAAPPFRREDEHQERAVEALWKEYSSHQWSRILWPLDEALSIEAEHAFTHAGRPQTRWRVVLERYARWWRPVHLEPFRRCRTANAVRSDADFQE